MNRLITKLTTAAFVLVTALAVCGQTPRIAGLDFQKLFNGYWKTAQATNKLQIQVADIERERNAIRQQFKKAEEEFKKLQEDASDQTVSAEMREKRKKAAEDKLGEMKQIDQAFQQFNQNAQANYQETQDRMVRNIVKELREAVQAKAKSAGYSLVVNTANDAILYSNVEDITESLVKEMNDKAPPGAFDLKPVPDIGAAKPDKPEKTDKPDGKKK